MSSSITTTQKNKWWKFIPLAIFIILAIIFAVNWDIDQLEVFISNNKSLGTLIFLTVYALLGLTPLPSEPVTFLALTLNGTWFAIGVVTVGNVLASLLEYFLGDQLGGLADFEQKKEKLPAAISRLPVQSPVYQLVVRAIPGFGPKFVSISSGIYRVPLTTYIWTSFVANMVGGIVIVLTMSGIISLFK
jgi:uncharacterized membrane protein YdjX (TVP38/TMEM64 family)